MFTIGLIVWSVIVIGIVNRYIKFNRVVVYSPDDDDMVGHSSVSETEEMENDYSDSDSEFDPDDEETEILMSFKGYDSLPDYMKDFYEETTISPEWMKLTDDQKKTKLDSDLDIYRTKRVRMCHHK